MQAANFSSACASVIGSAGHGGFAELCVVDATRVMPLPPGVEFDAGGRTHWHRHTGAQWLLIIDGRIRVQKWGEAAQDVGAGDTVVIEPGEKHWHGAAPGSSGIHLAVNLNSTTEWLEAVSDEPIL